MESQMNLNFGWLVIFLPVITGCNHKPTENAPRIESVVPSNRSLTVDSFRFIQSETTMQQVRSTVGEADREAGSGIYIYEYGLRDGSTVSVGSPDGSKILYVRHGNEVLFGR